MVEATWHNAYTSHSSTTTLEANTWALTRSNRRSQRHRCESQTCQRQVLARTRSSIPLLACRHWQLADTRSDCCSGFWKMMHARQSVCSVPFALQCAVCSVQCAVCSMQCAVCSVWFVLHAVCSVWFVLQCCCICSLGLGTAAAATSEATGRLHVTTAACATPCEYRRERPEKKECQTRSQLQPVPHEGSSSATKAAAAVRRQQH